MHQQVNEPSGAALVARIRAQMAEEGLEPDAREVEFLAIAEGLQDRIVDLDSAIKQHGLTNVTKGGLVRLNPAAVKPGRRGPRWLGCSPTSKCRMTTRIR